jgi:pimeloyl-ACP methyl ester carboxylesterase
MMRIVFLHGMPLDGTVWEPRFEAFPGALAPDLPGFGSRQLEGEPISASSGRSARAPT